MGRGDAAVYDLLFNLLSVLSWPLMSKDLSLPILVYGLWLWKYTFSGFYFGFLNKGWKN